MSLCNRYLCVQFILLFGDRDCTFYVVGRVEEFSLYIPENNVERFYRSNKTKLKEKKKKKSESRKNKKGRKPVCRDLVF